MASQLPDILSRGQTGESVLRQGSIPWKAGKALSEQELSAGLRSRTVKCVKASATEPLLYSLQRPLNKHKYYHLYCFMKVGSTLETSHSSRIPAKRHPRIQIHITVIEWPLLFWDLSPWGKTQHSVFHVWKPDWLWAYTLTDGSNELQFRLDWEPDASRLRNGH